MNYLSRGRIVGFLFLYAIFINILGSELLDAIVMTPGYLTNAAGQQVKVVLGGLLELSVAASVVGIPVVAYPVIKKYSPTLALGYLGIRIVEAAITVAIILAAFGIFSLSTAYTAATNPTLETYQLIGTLLQEVRTWSLMLYVIFFIFGSAFFYPAMYGARLMPRWLTIWGFIGIAIAFVGVIADMMLADSLPPEVWGTAMGLQEITMGIWLMVKGFDSRYLASKS